MADETVVKFVLVEELARQAQAGLSSGGSLPPLPPPSDRGDRGRFIGVRAARRRQREADQEFWEGAIPEKDVEQARKEAVVFQHRIERRKQRAIRPRRKRGFGPRRVSGFQKSLSAAGSTLASNLPGIAGSATGAAVGAATQSATLGAVAGSAVGAGISAAAAGGPVTIALAAVAVGAIAVKEAFTSLNRVVRDSARELSQISPQVSIAQSMAELRELQGQFRRGAIVGRELAGQVTAESKLLNEIERLKDGLLLGIAPMITEILKTFTLYLKLFNDTFPPEDVALVLRYLVRVAIATGSDITFGPLLTEILKAVLRIRRNTEKEAPDPLEAYQQLAKDFFDPTQIERFLGPVKDRKNIPVF